jgi:endonuclease YncB( thermonuclease family)
MAEPINVPIDGDTYVRACWPVHPVDGDTFDVLVDDGERHYHVERFRLFGLNTPELKSPDPATAQAARAARQYVIDWAETHEAHNTLTLNWPSVEALWDEFRPVPYFLRTTSKQEKYGRWLADFRCQQAHSLNVDLLASGLAVAYYGLEGGAWGDA